MLRVQSPTRFGGSAAAAPTDNPKAIATAMANERIEASQTLGRDLEVSSIGFQGLDAIQGVGCNCNCVALYCNENNGWEYAARTRLDHAMNLARYRASHAAITIFCT